MSPAFLSIGAVRTGTSLLSDYIMQHPSVVLPLAKEIGLGMFPLERYIRGQFPTIKEGEQQEKAIGKQNHYWLLFTRCSLCRFSSLGLTSSEP